MFRIYADGQLVCSSSVLAEDDYAIGTNASVDVALENKAGSFSFQLLPCHYLYNQLKKYKTVVSVWVDEDCIFIGRVMNFTTTTDGKTIYCEGCLSYFNDSIQYKFEKKSMTPRARLEEIVNNHNSQVDGYKQFKVGTVNVPDADISYEFEMTSPEDSFSALTGDLTDRFGGYFHVTEESSVLVLDWLQSYEHICQQPIMFGENLVEYSENDSENDIWSILYPTATGTEDQEYYIGSVNGGSNFYELPDRIAIYGRIVKSITFNDINSDSELLSETKKWVDRHATTPEPTVTITTVDLSSIFSNYESFSIGDTVTFKLEHDSPRRSLICSKISYNLFKPGVVQLTLGLEPQSLTDVYFNDKVQNDVRYQETQDHFSDTDANVRSNGARGAANAAAIEQAQKDIVVNANSITANAKNIQMNADRIEANAKEIDLKAYNKDLVWVDQKHTEHFEKVDGEISSLNEDSARLASRITSAEVEINGDEGHIGLKAQAAQLYGDVDLVNGRVDEQGEWLHEVSVDLDAVKGTLTLKADKIDLQGYVTMSEFEAKIAHIDNLFSGSAEVVGMRVSGLKVTGGLTVNGLSANWKKGTFVTDVWGNKSTQYAVSAIVFSTKSYSGKNISYVSSIGYSTGTIDYLGY